MLDFVGHTIYCDHLSVMTLMSVQMQMFRISARCGKVRQYTPILLPTMPLTGYLLLTAAADSRDVGQHRLIWPERHQNLQREH